MTDLVIINVGTGEEQRRPLTPDEETQRRADGAAAAAEAKSRAEADAKRQADEQAWRDAVKNASTLAALKDVLLGTNLPAQADVRPTGR